MRSVILNQRGLAATPGLFVFAFMQANYRREMDDNAFFRCTLVFSPDGDIIWI